MKLKYSTSWEGSPADNVVMSKSLEAISVNFKYIHRQLLSRDISEMCGGEYACILMTRELSVN